LDKIDECNKEQFEEIKPIIELLKENMEKWKTERSISK
jgi:hypothetical protein